MLSSRFVRGPGGGPFVVAAAAGGTIVEYSSEDPEGNYPVENLIEYTGGISCITFFCRIMEKDSRDLS